MTDQQTTESRPTNRLAEHLAQIRGDRGFSLRQVEELTNKTVSNAYLSQIENGKIQKPSPNILHALASLYESSYEVMMELAGYIVGTRGAEATHGRAATFAELNLSEAEEEEVLKYIKFLRTQRKD